MTRKKNNSTKNVVKTTSYGRTIKDPAKPSSLDPLKVEEAIKKITAFRTKSLIPAHS